MMAPVAVESACVKTRACMNSGDMLLGELKELSDIGAEVIGSTDGLSVGDEISLALMFSWQYSIEYLCEIRQINPGSSYCVVFKPRHKRCLMMPPQVPGPKCES
jgi:hypothetical protein